MDSVVVEDQHIETWRLLFSTLGIPPIRVAGVWLYRLHPDGEQDWNRGLLEMRSRFDEERFTTLIRAANEYLLKGGDLESLTTVKALDLGLISRSPLFGPTVVSFEPSLSEDSLSNTGPWLAYGLGSARGPAIVRAWESSRGTRRSLLGRKTPRDRQRDLLSLPTQTGATRCAAPVASGRTSTDDLYSASNSRGRPSCSKCLRYRSLLQGMFRSHLRRSNTNDRSPPCSRGLACD